MRTALLYFSLNCHTHPHPIHRSLANSSLAPPPHTVMPTQMPLPQSHVDSPIVPPPRSVAHTHGIISSVQSRHPSPSDYPRLTAEVTRQWSHANSPFVLSLNCHTNPHPTASVASQQFPRPSPSNCNTHVLLPSVTCGQSHRPSPKKCRTHPCTIASAQSHRPSPSEYPCLTTEVTHQWSYANSPFVPFPEITNPTNIHCLCHMLRVVSPLILRLSCPPTYHCLRHILTVPSSITL